MTEESDPTKTWEIAQAILRYLDKHPDAKDSFQGIAQWWLLRELSERRLADIERAISLLLSRNLIVEARRGGLPPFYGLNLDKRDAISDILANT